MRRPKLLYRVPDELGFDVPALRRVRAFERAIAEAIDHSGDAGRPLIDGFDRRVRELHPAFARAGDEQTMVDVSGDAFDIERHQLATDRNTLIHLAHLRQREARTQLRLTHQDDLK